MAKKTLICQEGHHNKFWEYTTEGTKATIKWGRIGGSSQQQIKDFPSESKMMSFLSDKVSEKMAKGYNEVDKEKLKEETKVAEELGHQHKIASITWVAKIGNRLKKIAEFDPDQFVLVEILNSWDKTTKTLLISKTSSGQVEGYDASTGNFSSFYPGGGHFVEAVRNYLKKTFAKVKEVVKTVAAGAMGVRMIDLGDDSVPAPVGGAPMFNIEEVATKVADSGVSKQVIATFAAMGNRLLDI